MPTLAHTLRASTAHRLRRSVRLAPAVLALATTAACASAPVHPGDGAVSAARAVRGEVPRTVVADQQRLAALTPTRLSANLVDRVIHDLPVDDHLAVFARMDPASLEAALDTRTRRLAFWINVYNGYAQHFLKQDASLYKSDRGAFFGKEQIEIAGASVSMEEIEHGILRRGATIFTLGHLRLLWIRSDFIRRFAVDTVDWRIHFALNCGAASCPPVMAYTAENVDAQLDANTRLYLTEQVKTRPADNAVDVPRLMRWFSADFGGGSAAAKRAILARYDLIAPDATPKLRYLPYDWSIQIENYAALASAAGAE